MPCTTMLLASSMHPLSCWPLCCHGVASQVYAFSVENWQRDAAEVSFLMGLFETALQQQLPELQQHGVRLNFMGEVQRLPHGLQHQIAACEAATAHNTQMLLNVAVSYSAQQDMITAVQKLAQQVQHGQLTPEQVSSWTAWEWTKPSCLDFS